MSQNEGHATDPRPLVGAVLPAAAAGVRMGKRRECLLDPCCAA